MNLMPLYHFQNVFPVSQYSTWSDSVCWYTYRHIGDHTVTDMMGSLFYMIQIQKACTEGVEKGILTAPKAPTTKGLCV